jgi:hypothetical protein
MIARIARIDGITDIIRRYEIPIQTSFIQTGNDNNGYSLSADRQASGH